MSVWQRAQEYIREVRAETAKVSWPTRAETRQATVVVLVAVTLLTAVIFVMDRAFVFVIELLFR
jgi:preprotein translocase subunit SecE